MRVRSLSLILILACSKSAPPVTTAPTTDTATAAAKSTGPDPVPAVLAAAAAASGPTGEASLPAIEGLAKVVPPGMTAEGSVVKTALAEGGHVAFSLPMDNTHCYVVAAAGDGITELDAYVLAPPLSNFILAQNAQPGPSLMTKELCPTETFLHKIDLHAKKGTGSAAAQLWSKPK